MIEEEKDILAKVDDPELYKKYVLRSFAPRLSYFMKKKQNKLDMKYCADKVTFWKTCGILRGWGLLTLNQRENPTYTITEKGIKALKWRKVDSVRPDFLTENRKYVITTSIAILALILSAIAIFRTF